MSRRRIVALLVAGALLAGPALLAHRLLYTNEGLRWVLGQLGGIDGVRIVVDGAEGTLAGPVSFRRVLVDHEAVRIVATDVHGDPSVPALFAGRLSLDGARIGSVEVTLKERPPQPPSETHFLPAWLSITADAATVRRVGVRLVDGTRLHVDRVTADVRVTRWRIDLAPFDLADPAGRVSGEAYLRGTLPLGLRVRAAGRWTLPDGHLYRFRATTDGRLDRLGVDLALDAPARAGLVGTVFDVEHDPHLVGTLRVSGFDGTPWLASGTLPSLTGSVALDATRRVVGLDGTLTSPSLEAGPLRLHGSARVDGTRVDVVGLKAWLPRSGATIEARGAIDVAGDAPRVALEGSWSRLRWPLTGDVVAESGAGTLRIDGAMPYAFDVNARLAAAGVRDADLAARGRFDRSTVTIDRIEGRLLRGTLRGDGTFALAAPLDWSANVDARGLDLATLRPDLPGRLDVTGAVSGRGYSPDGEWNARIERMAGTLRGRALTGRGRVSHRAGEYRLDGVRIANGDSHVDVDGRWGASADLRFDADLRALSIVDPAWSGSVRARGTVRGPGTRPEVAGTLDARALDAGGAVADTLHADVDVDLADRRDSRILVRAGGVNAGRLRLDDARLDVTGRVSNHDVTLRVVSPGSTNGQVPGFRATLEAAGGANLADRAWKGTLGALDVTFPDGAARLARPVEIAAGADAVRATPLCLVNDEARLCAEGEWNRNPAAWRVLVSAEDWPIRRLVTSLLGRREFDGRLQASGWAEQQPGHDWVGGAAIVLEEPTVDIRRNRFRADRTELGGGRIDLYADESSLRATADLDMAASTRVTGHAEAERGRGRPLDELAVRGELRAESAVISALPLFVPEVDRSEGRLQASVRVGGTLGEPTFDGDFHLQDGRLDLYRTNLSLTDATIDGRFVGDTLEFNGRARTRKGAMTLDGRFSWPDGVMKGSLHLAGDGLLVADTPDYRVQASPDLTVTAAGGEYTVTGEVVVPWARITPRDLSTSASVSADERIVGAEAPEAPPPAPSRVHMRVNMKLGDDVRVDSYGLKAHLGGEVMVTAEPGREPRGTGAIRVLDGEYKAFGVYVKIVKGVLTYQDSPLGRPVLDLVAEREIKDEDVTVSLNVRGPLDNPFITLSSNPAMPSNEALSYLLTGRSINTLQSSEAASVNRAAESLAVSGGGLLLGGLGSRLGLDEVSVEGSGRDDAQIVLGKFLSPKLFVSYGVSVAEAINTVKLRYTLNRRWSLRAEAGLEQSADVEFKIER
ncbi:MAG: translocation/assembly module TamB domain-containing protein [Steroidobacteraceae bacterium]